MSAQRSRALSVGLLVVGIGVLAAWRATPEAGLAPATQEAGLALALGSWRMSCRLPGRERGTDSNCVVLGDTQRGDIRRGDPSEGDADFPGFEAIDAQADELCLAEFEDFVGLPYEMSVLDFVFLTPSEESWRDGDRVVLCSIRDTTRAEMGSLRGARR